MYAAINLGFFEAEGLDIELTNGAGADKVMTAVLAGQADVGFMGPESTIYIFNEGKEDYVVNFAQLTKRDGSFLVGREPDPNFTWNKLKGTTIIGGRKGGMPEMTLEYVLKNKGLEPNKDLTVLTNIQFALMAGAFTGGTDDYVTLFEPVATSLEKEGKGFVVASVGKESGEVPYTVFSAQKSFIEENPELIQQFTNAIYKGQLWIEDHTPKEIVTALKPSFPDTDEDVLEVVIKRYRDQDTWAKTPVFTEEAFNRMQDILQEAGELSKLAPYDKLVTNEFAEAAIKKLKN
jgi:NitT/TauT family transport system substrate-binding protein